MKKWIALIVVITLVATGGTSAGFASQAKLKFMYETAIPDYIPNIVEAFMEENPNVKIELEPSTLEYFESGGLQLALKSGKGPDIIQLDCAPARMGLLAKAGLLLPLDKFYAKYDWGDKFFSWAVEQGTYGGIRYGLPHEVEFIGPLYNKEIFANLGLTEPKTYKEFTNILEKLKNADHDPPISLGVRDRTPGGWLFGNYIQACAGKEYFETILYGNGRWDTKWMIRAASEMQNLVKQGYIDKQLALALKGEEADNELWWTGKSGVFITGTWLMSDIIEHSFSGKWFPLPPINPELSAGYTGGLGSGFCVAKTTEYPEIVARVLNFLFFSDKGQREIIETSKKVPPISVEAENFDIPPVFKNVIATLKGKEIGYNPSVWVPAVVKEAYYDNIVGLIGLMVTPEQAYKNIQAAQDEWREKQSSK